MFASYNALVETVERWLARDDLTDDVGAFIWLAEVDLQRAIDFRMRDAIATGTTKDTQRWIELPRDYVEGELLRWTSDDSLPTIGIASHDRVDALQKSSSTTMRVGAVHGNRLYIGPTPGTADYELLYKAGVQHLGAQVPTNILLEQYPDALLYGALVHSAPFLGADERLQTWMPLYESAKEMTRASEESARYGPGALRMRTDVKVY